MDSVASAINVATFVFDASMPRDAFLQLVQTNDGVIPRIVRRLMEKHGSEVSL